MSFEEDGPKEAANLIHRLTLCLVNLRDTFAGTVT